MTTPGDTARGSSIPTIEPGRGCVVPGPVVVVLLIVGLLVVLFFWWVWAPALWPEAPVLSPPERPPSH